MTLESCIEMEKFCEENIKPISNFKEFICATFIDPDGLCASTFKEFNKQERTIDISGKIHLM